MRFWAVVFTTVMLFDFVRSLAAAETKCDNLLTGQFYCHGLELVQDGRMPSNIPCHVNNSARVECVVVDGISCDGLLHNGTFFKDVPCSLSSGKDWRLALLLSIFLGWLGIDRFYLGYYGVGLFKLCTCGFFLIFHLADVILIALQVVQPADGSPYKLDFYGPWLTARKYTNETALL